MTRKYQALRIIIWTYRIFAILAIMGGILGLVASAVSRNGDLATGVASIVGGLVSAIILFGMSELFQLLIDIEENTRATIAAIRQLVKK